MSRPAYDRALLLSGAKRNAELELWEVEQYGKDSYGDPDYVSIYGMRPAQWYAKGVRVLGRTAVECTRDDLGRAIGRDVAAVARQAGSGAAFVIDPFAGSGNTLYWILRGLPGSSGLGFELDAAVFRLTRRNIEALQLPIDVQHIDHAKGLAQLSLPADRPVVAFIAPPWGDALDVQKGLDLERTSPPIGEIADQLMHRFKGHQLVFAIQVYEKLEPASLQRVRNRFDWSRLSVYGLNEPGCNHGVLLCTKNWQPEETQ